MSRSFFFFLWMILPTLCVSQQQSAMNSLPKMEQTSNDFKSDTELQQLGSSGVIMDLPKGGITQSRLPESSETFVYPAADLKLKVEVAGARNYNYWKKSDPAEKNNRPPAYKKEMLPRTDDYLFYISNSKKYEYPKPNEIWKEFYLVLRSDELAARIIIELPASSLEKGKISVEEIKQILANARLEKADIDSVRLIDPRIKLDIPASFVKSDLPTLTFAFRHERKPIDITVRLSDMTAYKEWENWIRMSARVWKRGQLSRMGEYYYYYVSGSDPEFKLVFPSAGKTVEVHLSVPTLSFNKGDIKIEEIEHILSSARIAPVAEKRK